MAGPGRQQRVEENAALSLTIQMIVAYGTEVEFVQRNVFRQWVVAVDVDPGFIAIDGS
jgi:hypothetical protein